MFRSTKIRHLLFGREFTDNFYVVVSGELQQVTEEEEASRRRQQGTQAPQTGKVRATGSQESQGREDSWASQNAATCLDAQSQWCCHPQQCGTGQREILSLVLKDH